MNAEILHRAKYPDALKIPSFKPGGNIQGESRKFLGLFKRHFGSQILSESLKQGHIYSQ